MARTAITNTSVTAAGYNLTDSADFTTLTTGDGNGVTIPASGLKAIILKNDTGGSAVFTLIVNQRSEYTAVGVTIPDDDITVATAKDYVVLPRPVYQDSNGLIKIDCDVAGKVLALKE